jgi:hypothetical protein
MGVSKPRTRRPSRKRQMARHGRELVRWEACGCSGRASARSSRGLVPRLNGTAVYGPVRTVVWDPGANHSRGPDSILFIFGSTSIGCSRASAASPSLRSEASEKP